MIIVNIHDAKTRLSQLLLAIEQQHQTVRICRNGKPIADLVPVQGIPNPLQIHPDIAKIKLKYDPTQPLSKDEWSEK